MKRSTVSLPSALRRLNEWLEAPTPPWSLAVGSTCGCDLSHMERKICEVLNESGEFAGCRFSSFDHQDVRQLAGQPVVRRFLIDRAGLTDPDFDRWNDYEMVLRGLASIGGLVLGGKAVMDATHELPNVCRVMLAGCDECREKDLDGRITPSAKEPERALPEIIASFRDWVASRNPEELALAADAPRRID